jgi:hypothetical protein
MSRTFAHLPSRIREDRGLHYDPAGTARLPTHGRSGYFRSINRAEGSWLVHSTARERRALIHTLTTIRTLGDASDEFGDGWYAADPHIMGDVSGRKVGFRMRWDTEPPRYATYDPTPDDEAQSLADREWEDEMRDWWVWQQERELEMAERDAEFAGRCPCCGRRD